jgi:nitroreductase
MTGDEELSNEELMPIFEEPRWAPSAFNTQPWRFLYAKRNTVREEVWNRFFNLLVDRNKEWAKNAAVLTVVISKKEFEYDGRVLPLTTRQFDTGAAWENLALEAHGCDSILSIKSRPFTYIKDLSNLVIRYKRSLVNK